MRGHMPVLARQGSSMKDFNISESQHSGDDPWLGMGKDKYVRFALGLGAWQLFGSYQSVAEQIRELYETGLESVLVAFFDPLRGLHQMEDDLLPLLKKMNLRV